MERVHAFLDTATAEQTIALGRRFGKKLWPGSVIALVGPLGGGKTTFVKGLAQGLGFRDADEVTSPTFVVLHQYQGRYPIFHLDLYRLEGLADVEEIGWDDFVSQGGVVVVEWARKVGGYLPKEYLEIGFELTGDSGRRITLLPQGERYESLAELFAGRNAGKR